MEFDLSDGKPICINHLAETIRTVTGKNKDRSQALARGFLIIMARFLAKNGFLEFRGFCRMVVREQKFRERVFLGKECILPKHYITTQFSRAFIAWLNGIPSPWSTISRTGSYRTSGSKTKKPQRS
jgi:hypothetical protein